MTQPPPTPTPWYREAFQEGYLELYGHRNLAEAARAIELLVRALEMRPTHEILDLCCGPGRHLFFARQHVRRAVGLDLSRVLLSRAAEHLQLGFGEVAEAAASPAEETATAQPALLVQGTMRRLPFPTARFDRVLNLFTSFGYFADEAANRHVLAEVARVLRPGGRMAIDHINRTTLLAGLQPRSERALPDGGRLIEERVWRADTCRVEKNVLRQDADGRERTWRESVRVYEPEELEGMLRDEGLEPFARLGDYAGAAWTPQAPRLILLARR